jgi:hypothetical protein
MLSKPRTVFPTTWRAHIPYSRQLKFPQAPHVARESAIPISFGDSSEANLGRVTAQGEAARTATSKRNHRSFLCPCNPIVHRTSDHHRTVKEADPKGDATNGLEVGRL